MCVGGLIRRDEDGFASVCEGVDPLHAVRVLSFARAALKESSTLRMPGAYPGLQSNL
jgi:hypothetical protein